MKLPIQAPAVLRESFGWASQMAVPGTGLRPAGGGGEVPCACISPGKSCSGNPTCTRGCSCNSMNQCVCD